MLGCKGLNKLILQLFHIFSDRVVDIGWHLNFPSSPGLFVLLLLACLLQEVKST